MFESLTFIFLPLKIAILGRADHILVATYLLYVDHLKPTMAYTILTSKFVLLNIAFFQK